MGARSQHIGATFERSIALEKHGLPVLFKVPTARTRGGRETKKTWLDYAGMLPDGRFLSFDAKWIGKAARVQRSVLSQHQRAWCEQVHAAGGLAFAYVGAVDERGNVARHIVPWAQLRAAGSLALAPYVVAGLVALTQQEVLG